MAPQVTSEVLRTGVYERPSPRWEQNRGFRTWMWMRCSACGPFTRGVGTMVVDSQGKFTWSRKIRASKVFTAYVAYRDLTSTRVVWKKLH